MPRGGGISRERILRSARAEFLEKGFDGAYIRSIAAGAGVTSAALYRHFASKPAGEAADHRRVARRGEFREPPVPRGFEEFCE